MFAFLLKCEDATCGKTYIGDRKTCPHCDAPDWAASPAPLNPRDYVYDIETYPNCFTMVIVHVSTMTKWQYECSDRKNELPKLYEMLLSLKACRARMVGYNNENFDWPVVQFIMNCIEWVTYKSIYQKAMEIIGNNEKFSPHAIWPRDRYIEQLDLFRIHHFDNLSKSTSLKALELAMHMDSVEDLPFPVGTILNDEQKDVLLHYNGHDVIATGLFYVRSLPMIELREQLSIKFNHDFMNHNDVKMGKDLLVIELKKHGIECYEKVGGRRQPRQTQRAQIALGEVIFPYVKFERPEFEAVRQYLSVQVIRETKGVFTDIKPSSELLKYRDPCNTKLKIGDKWKNESKFKGDNSTISGYQFDNLHCVVNGFDFYFGTGGLHASVESQVIRSTDKMKLVDVDVASFYPNLAIVNKLYPAHLGVEYCDAYLGIYETRQGYGKGTPENAAYKLALNGTYGGSNDAFSPFFDPFYTMSITINGQMLLCMLVEQLIKIPGLRMIQCNTDGVTYHCPVEFMEHQRAIQKWWQKITCLELEESLYAAMFIRDVNSYMAVKENGKVKRIGCYAHETPDQNPGTREMVWHKDPSALIIPKAAEAALVHGKDIREFILAHDDPFDFMLRAKVPRASKLVMRWPEYDNAEMQLPNIVRYFVSRTGGLLIKVSPPTETAGAWKRRPGITDKAYHQVLAEIRGQAGELDTNGTPWDERIHTKSKSTHGTIEAGICAGQRVTDCSRIEDFDRSALDIDWYVKEVEKIVTPLLTASSK